MPYSSSMVAFLPSRPRLRSRLRAIRGGRFVRRLATRLGGQAGHESASAIWETVQLARHQDRPYPLDYVARLLPQWEELHGDRLYGDDAAIFEATHGSAPKYKGQNKVNPTALILSAKLMLEHLGETKAAEKLDRAVADVIAEGKDVTYDMKASRTDPTAVGTREMAEAICTVATTISGGSEFGMMWRVMTNQPLIGTDNAACT